MAALRRVEIERRSGPALRLENRSEQERAELHPDLGFLRQRSDPHGGEIGIGRGKIEPEMEYGKGHAGMQPAGAQCEATTPHAWAGAKRALRFAAAGGDGMPRR